MPRVMFGSYVLNCSARQVSREGDPVHIEPKVMDLLLYLVEHPDRCISKDELRPKLWPDVVVGNAALSRLVKELRKTLAEVNAGESILRTVHGRGYQFVGSKLTGTQEIGGSPPPEPPTADGADGARLCIGPQLSKVVAPLECVAAAFGIASVAAAFSTSAHTLIASRALLGIAGAAVAPSTLSLIRNMFLDPEQRTFAIGVWITSYSVGGAIGPLIGGALLEAF